MLFVCYPKCTTVKNAKMADDHGVITRYVTLKT
jgi:hypothetical protein